MNASIFLLLFFKYILLIICPKIHEIKNNLGVQNDFGFQQSENIFEDLQQIDTEEYCFDSNNQNHNLLNIEEKMNINSIQTLLISYHNALLLKFNTDNNKDDIRINIHSINCKIDINIENVDSKDNSIYQMNDDTFSFKIIANKIKDAQVRITPLLYSIDKRISKNIQNKTCPLIISNHQINNENIPDLKLINNTYIYFDSNFKKIQFTYNINNIEIDNLIALSLSFNQKSQFKIRVSLSGTEEYLINKNISNSSNIFFENEFNKGNELKISIEYINNTLPIFMNIKMVKQISISILEQNNLNLGFINSKIQYQYYYMEVFKQQEGEIMLHTKRQKGILFAKLIDKNDEENLNDIDTYPKYEDDSSLKFNEHTFRLAFNHKDTLKCENGCYLLLTYYKENYDKSDIIVRGYEYTILSRIWDYMEFSPQIINIPFNEYILGSFYKGSINHHYYSIFIPNNTEKIIIQLEGNYLDCFIGEGIVKLNTLEEIEEIKNLNIINNQYVIELTKEDFEFEFSNNYISLAFRSKNYFEDIFPFYYFRILYLKEKEILYYPIDSNFGNLCSPIYENGKYYCYLLLNNNYNELSSSFAIAGANQIEYFKIYYAVVLKDKNESELKYKSEEFKYIYHNDSNNKNFDYFIFKFEYSEFGFKNILTAFNDKSTDVYPQIYSAQMYYLFNITKTFHYSLIHNYTLNYKWIGGWVGIMNLNLPQFKDMYLTRNYRGKPIGILVSNETKKMNFSTNDNSSEYVFYLKLNYNIKNKGIEEIYSGETKSEIISGGHFPLYYYLNLNIKNNISLDINIRLNSYNISELKNDFEIKGYIVNQDDINRIIRGEFIQLKNETAYNGIFSEGFNLGNVHINKDLINYNEYILISIINKDKTNFISNLLIEIVSNEYADRYFMPINQYIIESFGMNKNYTRKENKYEIDINDIKTEDTSILIEFSPNYNDLILDFETQNIIYNQYNISGFRKYRIIDSRNQTMVKFSIKNPHKREDANYMLRYFYSYEKNENNYILNKNYIRKDEIVNSEKINIYLTFPNINITRNSKPLNVIEKSNVTFFVYGYLYPKDETKEEIIDTSTFINNRKHLYKVENTSIYGFDKNICLNFKNILREHNYEYELQLRVNVYINDNIFNEEFLTYILDLNLKDIKELKKEENEDKNIYIWIGVGVGVLLIIIIIVGFFIFRKLKKDNTKLKEEVLSISFSSGIERNVLKEEKKKNDNSDYDLTFI